MFETATVRIIDDNPMPPMTGLELLRHAHQQV